MARETSTSRPAAWDDPLPPRVPEPLFPVLRRMTGLDVQKARAWLLAWLLNRLGQRVQTPPPPAYSIQRWVGYEWRTVAGPFHRMYIAELVAREFATYNRRWRYRVVGPGTEKDVTTRSTVLLDGRTPPG
jgi:hypothetical protein